MTAIHEEHAGALFAFVLRLRRRPGSGQRRRPGDAAARLAASGRPGSGPRGNALLPVRGGKEPADRQWRAEQRRPRLVSDEGPMASAVAPDELAGAVEGWLVADAVDRLTPAHRAVIETLYFQGRTVADAAKLLDLPEGTIKSRSYYAVRTLRTIFEEMGVVR
ncbi:MAG: sigma factor-like helix-turn-helix DNA-binding protein [Dermatophilaceae bacterium]